MRVQLRPNGVIRYATARVIVYSTFGVDVDRSAAFVGDTVVFTPKYNSVPGAAAKWTWAPDSGPTRPGCAASVQDCKWQVTESGSMWAYSSSAGGDSDSKHVDAIYDTTDAGCLQIDRRRLGQPRGPRRPQRPSRWQQPRGFVNRLSDGACAPPLGPDTALQVHCYFPGTNARGDTVACTAKMKPALPFTIRERQAERWHVIKMRQSPPYAMDSIRSRITDSAHVSYAAGDSSVWRGPAITSTRVIVSVDVTLPGGRRVTFSGHDSFSPGRRAWTPWYWDPATATFRDDTIRARVNDYSIDTIFRWPLHPQGEVIGVNRISVPSDTSVLGEAYITVGPDSDVAYPLHDAPFQTDYFFVHPALKRPPASVLPTSLRDSITAWQNKQTGGSAGGGKFYCDTAPTYGAVSSFDSLYSWVRRHEGATHAANSHWGVMDSVFRLDSIHKRIEGLSFSGFNGYQILEWRFGYFYGGSNSYTGNHSMMLDHNAAFDSLDYASRDNVCKLRF